MNRRTTYSLFGIVFAIVAAGMIGNNLLTAYPSGIEVKESAPTNDGMKMMGHVTTIATDANGNIKAYRQSDNVVVANGKNCVNKLLFGGTVSSGSRGAETSTGACTGALTSPWNVIAIGNGTQPTSANTDYALAHEPVANSNGLDRKRVDTAITYTNSTGSSAKAVLQTTFGPMSGLGTAGTTITESGLFNDTTVGATGMFAHQDFTGIKLNNGDSLTIKWTISTG